MLLFSVYFFQDKTNYGRAYVKNVHIHDCLLELIPSELGGKSDDFFGDAYWSANTGQLLLVGGSAAHGAFCGLGCTNSDLALTHSSANCGSRLAFFGEAEIVATMEELAE